MGVDAELGPVMIRVESSEPELGLGVELASNQALRTAVMVSFITNSSPAAVKEWTVAENGFKLLSQ